MMGWRTATAMFALALALQGCASSEHIWSAPGGRGQTRSFEDYSWLSASLAIHEKEKSAILGKYATEVFGNEIRIREELRLRGVPEPKAVNASCMDDKECWVARSLSFVGVLEGERQLNAILIDIFPDWARTMIEVETHKNRLAHAKSNVDRLIIRAEIDQLLRRSLISPPGRLNPTARSVWRALAAYRVAQSDYENSLFIKQMLQSGQWPKTTKEGAKASDAAWLLAQHADFNQLLQLDILENLERLLKSGEVSGKNYAFLYDRVWGELRGKQRYGTQWLCRDGVAKIQELEDPERLNQLRSAVGLEPVFWFEKECQGMNR